MNLYKSNKISQDYEILNSQITNINTNKKNFVALFSLISEIKK